jgi:hypothetical protein
MVACSTIEGSRGASVARIVRRPGLLESGDEPPSLTTALLPPPPPLQPARMRRVKQQVVFRIMIGASR